MVGRRVIVYDLVGSANIDNALALEASGGAIALALGALGGGALIQTVGIGWALIVMGALQIVSFSTFVAVPAIERMQQVATAGISTLLDGVRMLRTEKSLVSILGVTACVNFFFFSSSPLLQVVGGKFDVGPALLGLLAAMLGIGMFGGCLAVARYQPERRGLLYVGGSYLAFMFMIGFALAPWYIASAVCLAVAASGMGLFASTQAVLVMDSVSEERRGRALGLLSSAIGVLPIGMLVLGEMAELLGTSLAITISVITGAVLMTIFLRIRPETLHLRQNSDEVEASTTAHPPGSRGLPPTVFDLKPV
jgi:predicted MFS family arabinose efflux permease